MLLADSFCLARAQERVLSKKVKLIALSTLVFESQYLRYGKRKKDLFRAESATRNNARSRRCSASGLYFNHRDPNIPHPELLQSVITEVNTSINYLFNLNAPAKS